MKIFNIKNLTKNEVKSLRFEAVCLFGLNSAPLKEFYQFTDKFDAHMNKDLSYVVPSNFDEIRKNGNFGPLLWLIANDLNK